ncbi:putative ribonuclease H-like domain-containing protein [Tanacetum coccineum]
MDLETAQTNTIAKLPLLKQGEYDMWKLRIEQYFQIQDYALWDVIENRNSFKPAAQTTTNAEGSSTRLIPGPVTADEKTQKKNNVKEKKDLNLKILRSLPSEWNTRVVELQAHQLHFSYLAFMSSTSSTNEVNTAYGVSTANTQVSTASTQVSTANLSDDTVYAFLASQPNGSQLVHEDLEQIHKDDLEEMDLKWQLALLSMRTRKGPRNQDNMSRNQDSSRRTINVEEISSKAMLAIDGAGLFLPLNLDLSNSGLEEFQQPEFEGYGPKTSKSVSKDTSNEVRESHDASLTVNRQKKPVRKPVKYAEMYMSQTPRGNQRNWNNQINTAKGKVNTARLKVVNTARPNTAVVNAVRANQMCDKKNSVLFTDAGCFVLSPDFKLADESQVLLKVPRKNNMYIIDMKNIVPKECLTCLVAKATLEESMLWHRRLGHVNFKNINKLVKENLMRGLPAKRFEKDQTCVACLKGKQHKASCKSKI